MNSFFLLFANELKYFILRIGFVKISKKESSLCIYYFYSTKIIILLTQRVKQK